MLYWEVVTMAPFPNRTEEHCRRDHARKQYTSGTIVPSGCLLPHKVSDMDTTPHLQKQVGLLHPPSQHCHQVAVKENLIEAHADVDIIVKVLNNSALCFAHANNEDSFVQFLFASCSRKLRPFVLCISMQETYGQHQTGYEIWKSIG